MVGEVVRLATRRDATVQYYNSRDFWFDETAFLADGTRTSARGHGQIRLKKSRASAGRRESGSSHSVAPGRFPRRAVLGVLG